MDREPDIQVVHAEYRYYPVSVEASGPLSSVLFSPSWPRDGTQTRWSLLDDGLTGIVDVVNLATHITATCLR